MPHHPSAFGLTAKYNDFLFAPIGEQANGMQLSVLSALTRMNVDPWEEAARLATMPPGEAEWTLVATLSKVPGRTWSLSDTEGIAKRRNRCQEGWCATDKLLVDVARLSNSDVTVSTTTSPNDGESGCHDI
jgi:hypothetical protein